MLKIFCDDNDKKAIGHVLERLKANYKPFENQHIIITPTSYTLGMETLVLDSLGVKGAFNISVSSFERVCAKSLKNAGKSYLSREGAVMVMRKVINANAKKLKHYAGSCKRNTFASDIYRAIENLRLSGHSPQSLEEALPNLQSSTCSKLKDIILIYKAYEEEIARFTPDLITVYNAFIANIQNEEEIKNAYVYIMGFNTLSNKEIELIKVISEHAIETNIALSFVPGDEVNVETTPTKTFSRLRDAIEDIEIYARGQYVSSEDEIEKINAAKKEEYSQKLLHLKDLEDKKSAAYRMKTEDKKYQINELDFLRSEIFTYSDLVYEDVKQIQIYAEDNVFSEIHAVANEIITLVRDYRYRYKDITIFNALYENNFSIKEIFERYGIPVFVPERVTLSESLIFDYLISILEFIKNPRDVKKALKFIKHPLFYDDFSEVCKFENYIYEKNITYKDFEKPFKNNVFDKFRKKVSSIIALFNKKTKSVNMYTDACFRIIDDRDTKARFSNLLRGKSSEDFEFNQRSVDLIIDILHEIEEILGEEEMDIIEFISILSSGAKAQNLLSIPGDLDCVYVAQVGNSKVYENKIAFVIGLTSDSNLDNVFEDRIFTSYDNRSMDENDIAIYPLVAEKIKNNRYEFVDMLSKFDRFYFSYPKLSIKGEKTQSSIALEEIKKLIGKKDDEYESLLAKYSLDSLKGRTMTNKHFETYLATSENAFFKLLQIQNLIIDKTDENFYTQILNEIYKYIDKDKRKTIKSTIEVCDGKCANNTVKNLLSYTIKKDKEGRYLSSVSQIEEYYTCPFKHFMSYGLGAYKRSEGFILPTTIGIIVHNVLEDFFKKTKDQIDVMTDKTANMQIEKSIEKIFADEEIQELYKNPQNKYFLNRIKDEIRQIIKNLIKQIRKGSYRPKEIEMSFGFNENEAKIEIPVTEIVDGKEKDGVLLLRGKIDRVDVTENENGQNFIAVIDYKTGNKALSIGSIYIGQTIQLIVYLQALMKDEKYRTYRPGFVSYLKLRDNYTEEQELEADVDMLNFSGFFNPAIENLYSFDKNIIENPADKDTFAMPEFEISKLEIRDEAEMPDKDIKNKNKSIDLHKGYQIDRENLPVIAYNGQITKIVSDKGFETLIKYVEKLIARAFKEIQQGNIEMAPTDLGDCKYCDYKQICDASQNRNKRYSVDIRSARHLDFED